MEMGATQVSRLYVVELRTLGWAVGISHSPEERILTTIARLSREQRNRLQYLKVKFYRVLDRLSVLRFGEKYVVPQRRLPEVEAAFRNIYGEFIELRRSIFEEISSRWDEIKEGLEASALRMGIEVDVSRLRPSDEDFLDMRYTITPLDLSVNQLVDLSERFEQLAREKEEYRTLAQRLREEAARNLNEVRKKYEEKVKGLERAVNELKKALTERSREVYRLRLKAKEVAEEAAEIAEFLGPETLDDLKSKLDALKEYFAT